MTCGVWLVMASVYVFFSVCYAVLLKRELCILLGKYMRCALKWKTMQWIHLQNSDVDINEVWAPQSPLVWKKLKQRAKEKEVLNVAVVIKKLSFNAVTMDQVSLVQSKYQFPKFMLGFPMFRSYKGFLTKLCNFVNPQIIFVTITNNPKLLQKC